MSDDNVSVFGELDIENASADPFFKENGTYLCLITEAPISTSAKGNRGMNIKYIIQEGDYEKESIRDYKSIPFPWQLKGYQTEEDMANETSYDDELKRRSLKSVRFLKQRLREFGFPDEKMSSLQPEDIIGVGYVWVQLGHKQNGDDLIMGVKLAQSDSSEGGSPFDTSASTPF